MIDDIREDAEQRMNKTLESLDSVFARIRTGRAHPGILDGVLVSYYGNDAPITQMANVVVEDGRTLLITPWEKSMIGDIEKAILKSGLGLNPATASENIRRPKKIDVILLALPKRKPRMLALRYVTSVATPILTLRISLRKKKLRKMMRERVKS